MKVVIDIPEEAYDFLKLHENNIRANAKYIIELKADIAILDGKPLPKGHGRLIDADVYREEMLNSREFDFFKRLDMQPTIIEADKEE